VAENSTSGSIGGNLESGARLAVLGIAVNALLAVIKIAAGVLGNTYALIADGIESVLDIGGSLVIWGGLKFAARPPDTSHPYGHGKAEPLAAIAVSIFVIGAAAGLAIQSIREILVPHQAPAPFTLIVLVAVILTKEILYRKVGALGVLTSSTALKSDAWHHRSDAITSGAAFIGIALAVLGGPAFVTADEWAALFACVLIACNGFRLLKPAMEEVMDTAPPSEKNLQIKTIAASVNGVIDVEKCFVRKMGISFYVDLHVGVDANITVRAGHEIAHQVKNAVQEAIPLVADVLVHIEPVESMTIKAGA
jgi:cation diffusion facilitator family transporter